MLWTGLLLLFLPVLCLGEPTEEQPQTLCGRKLAYAHMLYCYSPDNFPNKRSQPHDVSPFKYGVSSPVSKLIWSWLASREAHPYAIAMNTRNKRNPGLVDECCLKPCYTSELLSYC